MNEPTKVDQVLGDLTALAKEGLITKDQVLKIFDGATPQTTTADSKINLQKIMYYIGGFIVLIGIVFFVYQFWGEMSQISKTILTLGSAVSAYALGYYFYHNTVSKDFGHAFLIISAALFPIGVGTALDTIGISATNPGAVSINLALLFLVYFSSFHSLKAKIFLPFSIIAASALFFSFTDYIFGPGGETDHFTQYRFLILGLSYISFGYYFSSKETMSFMKDITYLFGLGAFLGSALTLQGFKPEVNVFWQLTFPALLVLVFYGSIKLQNKVFLVLATLFTFAEIFKLTAEYFSESIGWPISLIIAGLIIMGTGYLSFELNKRFIAPK